MNFVAIDFETANSKRYSACSIAFAVVEDDEITYCYESLIRPPDNYFSDINTKIHGITLRNVLNVPYFDEVWNDIEYLISDCMLVAHNAPFDMSVLRSCLDYYKVKHANYYMCTYALSKRVWPKLKSYRLPYICSHLNIDLDHHCALSDAKACANIAMRAGLLTGHDTICDMVDSFNVNINCLL